MVRRNTSIGSAGNGSHLGLEGGRLMHRESVRLSRRQFLRHALAAAASASLWQSATAAIGKCRPVIAGSYWTYDAAESAKWGAAEWGEELDRQAALGFHMLWIANAQEGVTEKNLAPFSTLMGLCAARNIKVMLGAGTTPAWEGRLDVKHELAFCGRNIRNISDRFKQHPAFWAWYIPHEIYMCWGAGDTFVQALFPALVERCKDGTHRPVTISPFFILDRDKVFGDFRFNEPDEYSKYWAALIRRAGLDIVMLQDSGEHFSYVTNDMRRPFFQAMQHACQAGGARFWGNVEVAEFDCLSKEEFIRRYGRVHQSMVKPGPWRPVPIPRLRQKLELAAEYCEDIVSWGYQEWCRPALGDAARSWCAGYKEYLAAST